MLDDSSTSSSQDRFIGPPWLERAAAWVQSHSKALLFAGVTLQLGILLTMIALYAAPLVVGDRILLRTRPVDPRDMFRGEYVVLSYDFSRVDPNRIHGVPANVLRDTWTNREWLEDRTVYVSLEPEQDGKHYRAGRISIERPRSGRFLKGKFSSSQLTFGIEAYYVQEGEGRVLETLRNAGQLSAEVAVAPWGRAALCRLQ